MEELIKSLEKEWPKGENWAVTVLEGPDAGKKLLSGCYRESLGGYDVFCERLCQEPRLIVCGAGHVALAVIRMGKMLGFRVTVLEDREVFARAATEAGADQVLLGPFREGIEKAAPDADSYVVTVTRGHQYDRECLEEVLKYPFAYAGMMGSRRRAALVKEQLEEKGFFPGQTAQIHAPIGLAIGAETPEEIAVSILAEIIEVKNRSGKGEGFFRSLAEQLNDLLQRGMDGVLATIISRSGSAPRRVGTKMLVRQDGSACGTVGGGLAEYKITEKAMNMLKKKDKSFQTYDIELSGKTAAEEGMVCGGRLTVMLEYVSGRNRTEETDSVPRTKEAGL